MNDFIDTPLVPALDKPVSQIENCVRKHPGGTLLAAVGIGLAAIVIIRALTPPPPPRNRALRLLEDIQHRLTDLTHPAYVRMADLAEDGAHALSKGFDSLGGRQHNHGFDKFTRGFRSLFQ